MRLRRFKVAVAIAGSIAMASGCFGGASGGAGSSTSSYNRMDEDPGEPKRGGTFTVAAQVDPQTLDPHKTSSYTTHVAVGSIYSKLLDYKTGPDVPYGGNELEGDLATDSQANADATQWTFTLRQGVKFHNKAPVNGREFTSADVICTFDRIMAQGFQKYLLGGVTWSAPDPYTVVFTLSQSNATFDQVVANHFMEILPCEAAQGLIDLDNDAIGTGPFMLESWTRDQERMLVANPDYYEEGKPYLDAIHTIVMPDQQAQIAALRSGKIDSMSSLGTDPRQVANLAQEIDGLIVQQYPGGTAARVFMNMEREPFNNPKVREAIALAIDREGMIKSLRAGGTLTGAVTPLLDGSLSEDTLRELQPYDPVKAKELLAEAGYPEGFEASMVTTKAYGEVVIQEAQWVQQDLAKIGINVTIDIQEYATYFTETWPKKQYDLGFGLQTIMLSAGEFLSTEYVTGGARNWYGISDPQLDAMIPEAIATTDKAERDKKYQEIDTYITGTLHNPVSLYTYDTQDIYLEYVKNIWAHPEYGRRWMKDAWLDK